MTQQPASMDLALYAFEVDRHGGSRPIDLAAFAVPPAEDAAYRWAHLDFTHDGARRWIEDVADPIVAEALTVEDTRPRCTRHEDGVLLILRGVNLNPQSDP
ncbi:MAG: CorA family divalent cation transporter, partial [Pseudomonadota bacterium]